MNVVKKIIDLGDGRTIEIETGKLAKQADGAVVVRMGDTMLLATVCSALDVKPDTDFMPLSVDYKEKFSAMGRFPGGFTKREGRPSDYEILIARLVDRALRPLFPSNYHAETFVTINLISAEPEIMPDALAGLAASAALAVSDIPFEGPISEVRVARIDGKLKINPLTSETERADIDIMVGATEKNILMIEGEMNEVSEDEMLEAIQFAHEAIKIQCRAQMELAEEVGSTVKREYCHEENDEDLLKALKEFCYPKLYAICQQGITDKQVRGQSFEQVKADFIATLPEDNEINPLMIDRYFHDEEREAVRNYVLDTQTRLDGRKTTQIRPIWCEVDYLPCAHGSSIFTRGETQSLSTVTLGTKLDEKVVDEVMVQGKESFILHYNFPPFATGEAKASRGIGRREIGHGNLAHRALKRMIPSGEENPYTIRVVSDILESNGSSSMATVCAGTLALYDAGVKLKRPVTGIAMGLITSADNSKYAILSDILGEEDHLGDMDFKVCGTTQGITAVQMDIKIDGLSKELLQNALNQAKEGRLYILDKILETMPAPREDYKPNAPRIEKIYIAKKDIGAVIGSGGKTIQDIQAKTGTTITIEEVGEQGEVEIFSPNAAGIRMAKSIICGMLEEPEVGKVYNGTIKSIVQFGAFVEFLPQRDGLLHISEIDWKRINNVEDVLKVGDEIQVKLIGIEKGKFKLSRKVLLPRPQKENNKPEENTNPQA